MSNILNEIHEVGKRCHVCGKKTTQRHEWINDVFGGIQEFCDRCWKPVGKKAVMPTYNMMREIDGTGISGDEDWDGGV